MRLDQLPRDPRLGVTQDQPGRYLCVNFLVDLFELWGEEHIVEFLSD
jgi:hypothetical protein